jgi:flavin reductase (DIM6/NTAB) family NADH-FMN oxidoreductase RutF
MEELREVMRKWTTGVSIVTATLNGFTHGMTVGSLVSLSIDPPRVAITLANQTRLHEMVQEGGLFGVTILAEEQQSLSDRFSGSIADQEERMSGVSLTYLMDDIPALQGGLGVLACRVVHQYEMPQSTLFVAEVLEAQTAPGSAALVYANRKYHRLEL